MIYRDDPRYQAKLAETFKILDGERLERLPPGVLQYVGGWSALIKDVFTAQIAGVTVTRNYSSGSVVEQLELAEPDLAELRERLQTACQQRLLTGER